ncbi:unnamed protein product [Spirodela intermedia]|uniref:Uncharacterized protein n=1 Tax=Spirodela intermedia TaxID=51605 RepID=A0A7I8JAR2_SPIIN|nr:unnamed protein product [Spirodela intermedia]CAA6667071.1 unnamed protein product [Spirodela intermedia]
MGVEFTGNHEMEIAVEESGYFSDSEVVAHVQEALQSVALGDREQYDWLLYEVLCPTKRMSPDQEALLLTTLRALSGAVSYIDADYHQSLYSLIFKMSLWRCAPDVRGALIDLIISLAASSGVFLDGCLDMLVRNFTPPIKLQESLSDNEWIARKSDVVDCVMSALQHITDLVPLSPMRLWPKIVREMPKSTRKKDLLLYVECMLRLERSMIGKFVGSLLLKALMDRLLDLDTDISWEDIAQEDNSRGIFDMELEDVQENAGDDRIEKIQQLAQDSSQCNNTNEKLDIIDGLMALTCEHLKSCVDDGRLIQVFGTLLESFQKTVLNAYKSKFAQFIVFYACSLDPENCGVRFAFTLRDIFLSRTNPPLFRMSAVSYLGSYLSRAKFLGSSLVLEILESLTEWCFEYCQLIDVNRTAEPKVHRVFYSACQAVMYIFCFRMRSLMIDPHNKSRVFHMPFESVLRHPLDPLKVCLPSIVEEFLQQAKATHLFSSSKAFIFDNFLESELDMFFPFDPYLLKGSDRYIRPSFEFWSTVRKAYDGDDSEDEYDGDEDLENGRHGVSLEEVDSEGGCGLDGDQNPESESEGEDADLGCSLNKMSITPKDTTLKHGLPANLGPPARMPARIRPSTSPI